jgi:hypothetical protein
MADDDAPSEIRETIREHALKTTVDNLAEKGFYRVRVLDMDSLEAIFQLVLHRALERSLAKMPTAARRNFEREARRELAEELERRSA